MKDQSASSEGVAFAGIEVLRNAYNEFMALPDVEEEAA
jgi:hypothetical protein